MTIPPTPDEFLPLPFFPRISHPESLPLEEDECAAALFLAKGDLSEAERLLKVDRRRLKTVIRRSGRLRLLLDRLASG